jgi:hypothetical protein
MKPWEYVPKEGSKVQYEIPDKKRFEVVINGWLKVNVNLGDITSE